MFGPARYPLAEINKHLDHVSLWYACVGTVPPAFLLPCPPFSWSELTGNMFPPLISIREDRPQDYFGS